MTDAMHIPALSLLSRTLQLLFLSTLIETLKVGV